MCLQGECKTKLASGHWLDVHLDTRYMLCLGFPEQGEGEQERDARQHIVGLASHLHASGVVVTWSHLTSTQPEKAPFCEKGASSKWPRSAPPTTVAEGQMGEDVLGSDRHIREVCGDVTLCRTLQRKH